MNIHVWDVYIKTFLKKGEDEGKKKMEPLTTLAILLLCHRIHSFVIHNPNTLDSFENKVFQLQKT